MKKWRLIALAALLLALPWGALSEGDAPMYEAISGFTFNIRSAPEASFRVIEVPALQKVKVYEYQNGWYRVSYKKQMGWVKESWLWGFRSLDAAKYPVPGYEPEIGVITLEKSAWIEGGKFKGVNAAAGTVLTASAASESAYTLRVWRGEGALRRDAGTLTAFVPWQDARPGDLIGGFTTYYHEKQGYPLEAERQYNIALGCEGIDGAVVPAGATFSFNDLCGPYLSGRGYKMGPSINADGTGWGGGVCQVSTTLFDAVLGLPLQIQAWEPHQQTGVDYVPISLDAAVGYSSDFTFVNTLGYPLRIWAQPQGGVVTVLLYRAEE